MKRVLVAMLMAVAIAGCDAMTAHTGVVARVGSHDLTADEAVELIAGHPGIPAQSEVVESIANLWVDYTSLALVLAEDSAMTELELDELVEPIVEQRIFSQLREDLAPGDTAITDAELRAEFDRQSPGLRIRARHILLTYPDGEDEGARDSVRALAEELRAQAAGDADFAALARQHSQDRGTAQAGGDLGWFQRGRMVQPFEEAAFALEPGEVSEVVETPFGLHIIKLDEREAAAWDEETGEQFRGQLISQRRQEALNVYVDSLNEAAGVEVEEGAVDVARELAEEPSRRFSGRAMGRDLVTWEGGAITARDFVQSLRRLPVQQHRMITASPDQQVESMLRDLATNELVLEDARNRGLSVAQAEQDSIKDEMVGQLNQIARSVGLVGDPQEGESGSDAVDRRVRSFLDSALGGQQQLLPLGPLAFVLRDQLDWQINESTFPTVAERLEERRAAQQGPQEPGPPGAAQPQPTAPGSGGEPDTRPAQPDTTG